MVLTISIPAELEAKLRRQADARGEAVDRYVARLVTEGIAQTEGQSALAAFRAQVEDSGVSDDELDQFHEQLRDEVWRDQQRARRA